MEHHKKLKSNLGSGNELVVQDEISLLQRLPAEIWQHVITRLPKRDVLDTLENLYNSSQFYRTLLNSQKTTFLFGKVLNILVKDNRLLQLNDLLNCRQVCKTWNDEVDKMLTTKNYELRQNRKLNQFISYGEVDHFLAHFKTTHPKKRRSPFIGASVSLIVNHSYTYNDPEYQQLSNFKLASITTFLQRYKIHIKNISFSFFLNNNQNLKIGLAKLREWLVKMGTLKKLSVINKAAYPYRHVAENAQPFLDQPFPKLEKLEELHINQCIPEDIGMNLIDNNTHIIKLTVETNTSSIFNYDYRILDFPILPNLKYLSISINSIGKFRNLSNINFPFLSTLTLTRYLQRGYFYEQTRWSEIFSVLETEFGNTLERLSVEIRGCDRQVLFDTKTFQLNLPKLKELRLLVREASVSLDFLMPMKDSLERICIMVVGTNLNENVEGALINLLGFQNISTQIATKFIEFVHFDKSFQEIKDWVGRSSVMGLNNDRMIIGDKLILTKTSDI